MHERIGVRTGCPCPAAKRAPAVSARNSIDGRVRPRAAPAPISRKPRRLRAASFLAKSALDGLFEAREVAVIDASLECRRAGGGRAGRGWRGRTHQSTLIG